MFTLHLFVNFMWIVPTTYLITSKQQKSLFFFKLTLCSPMFFTEHTKIASRPKATVTFSMGFKNSGSGPSFCTSITKWQQKHMSWLKIKKSFGILLNTFLCMSLCCVFYWFRNFNILHIFIIPIYTMVLVETFFFFNLISQNRDRCV